MTKSTIRIVLLLLVAAFILAGGSYWWYLRTAHSTFERYYAFRGCQKLIEKTAEWGTCQLHSGTVIKIVKYQDKWYLDGDLPWMCWGKMCFGM